MKNLIQRKKIRAREHLIFHPILCGEGPRTRTAGNSWWQTFRSTHTPFHLPLAEQAGRALHQQAGGSAI